MSNNLSKDWEKFLNPLSIQSTLNLAAIYLAAYEILKWVIIDKIKAFLTFGDDERKYKNALKKHDKKDIFKASCLWLKEGGALSENDIKNILSIRKHRNDIAHELPKFLADSAFEVKKDYFDEIRELLIKIEVWWFKEVEMSTDPDLREVDRESIGEIRSGNMMTLDYFIGFIERD